MRKALLVAAAAVGVSGAVEAQNSPFGYNLSTYDTCAGLLLSVAWKLEATGKNKLAEHYKISADTHGNTAEVERKITNDQIDSSARMFMTAHAFINVLNTGNINDVVRQCDAMVPVLKEVNHVWDEIGQE